MRTLKTFVGASIMLPILFVAGCGGGGEDAALIDLGAINQPSEITYINWVNNANGEAVLDATNDAVKFRSDNGQMVFGSTTFSNISVNSNGGAITFNGTVIGSVQAIKSTAGSRVAAMVCTDGTLVDIFGTEQTCL